MQVSDSGSIQGHVQGQDERSIMEQGLVDVVAEGRLPHGEPAKVLGDSLELVQDNHVITRGINLVEALGANDQARIRTEGEGDRRVIEVELEAREEGLLTMSE